MKSKFWNYLLPIISGAIGLIIGGLVDWKTKDTLASKEFEYRLIESSLSGDINSAQRNLNFLLDIGLISKIDTGVLRDKIKSQDLPATVGYWDGYTMANLSSLLGSFYRRNDRFPKSLDEFRRAFPIELHLRILGMPNIRYQSLGDQSEDCKLSFAGEDNRWGTDDDKTLLTNDVLGR